MSDENDDVTNVVVLPLGAQRTTRNEFRGIAIARNDKMSCQHASCVLDPSRQELQCKKCGAEIDPYKWLEQHCVGPLNWLCNLMRERERLQAEVDALEKERDRLKSSVTGLRKRRGGM